jgi:putative transcriptional regulator
MFRSLAPGFLLATPVLQDPNFRKTVVFLYHHTPETALGLVVNRPGPRRLSEVLQATNLLAADPALREMPILAGGPVALESGWVVFEGHDPSCDSFVTGEGVEVTGSLEVFKSLLARKNPSRMLFLLGYSGWGPGQLESEVESGIWLPVPMSPRIIFDVPFDERWRAAFHGQGIDPDLWTFHAGEG